MNFILCALNPTKVLQKQVLQTEDDHIILIREVLKVRCHLMNAEIRQQACEVVQFFKKIIATIYRFLRKQSKAMHAGPQFDIYSFSAINHKFQLMLRRYGFIFSTLHQWISQKLTDAFTS